MTKYKVLVGDCVEKMEMMLRKKWRKFDFVFADPPFHIGQKYNDFDDQAIDDAKHLLKTLRWVKLCWKLLRSDGVLCLHGPDELAKYYLQCELHLGMNRIAWVNWHYRFGQCGRGNWIDARCHCLIYAKDLKSYTWNPDAVLVDSDRATTYNDPRINDHERGGKRLPGTVWGVPSDGPFWGRVQGNSQERRKGHPNQLPEVYLERLIKAYTNPGDLCLDPFCGSGTTATVAVALGRPCVTIDISAASAASARERITAGAKRVTSERSERKRQV